MKKIISLAILFSMTALADERTVIKTDDISGVLSYRNYAVNGGCEGTLYGWSNSGGTLARETGASHLRNGNSVCKYTGSGTVTNDGIAVSGTGTGIVGSIGAFAIWYKTASTNHKLRVLINAVQVDEKDLQSSTNYRLEYIEYQIPTTGTPKIQVYSGDSTPIYFQSFIGDSAAVVKVGSVSQATLVGKIAFGQDCGFSRTSSNSFANYSDDATCTTTVYGGATIAGATRPAITIPNASPGNYVVKINTGLFDFTPDAQGCVFRVYDGATALDGNGATFATSTYNISSGFSASISYFSAGSRTFDLQGTGDGNSENCGTFISSGSIGASGSIEVYRFPLATEQAYRPDMIVDYTGNVSAWAGDCPTGTIPATNKTIGGPSSGADYAGSAYYRLYEKLWALPGLSTTAGEPFKISSAKGASASADWSANKTIAVDFTTNELFVRQDGSVTTLGGYQSSDNLSHIHGLVNSGSNSFEKWSNTSGDFPAVRIGAGGTGTNYGQITAAATGAAESRPKNVALNYCVNWSGTQPMPILVGGVTTDLVGVAKGSPGKAKLTCGSSGSAILGQVGSYIASIANGGTGTCTATFKAGYFPTFAACVCSGNALDRGCAVTAVSTASATFQRDNSGAAENGDIWVDCGGY